MSSVSRGRIDAILIIAAVPECAHAQKPSAAKVTKADAQKVVNMISGDKGKTQTYCDLVKLGDQFEEVDPKDTKKTAELNLNWRQNWVQNIWR